MYKQERHKISVPLTSLSELDWDVGAFLRLELEAGVGGKVSVDVVLRRDLYSLEIFQNESYEIFQSLLIEATRWDNILSNYDEFFIANKCFT